jgi:hypothetical protein
MPLLFHHLAAAATTATAAAFVSTARIDLKAGHRTHLLSQIDVCLYIWVKKERQESVFETGTLKSSSGANLIINCPQQATMRCWFSV